MSVPVFLVDAFAERPYAGNTAAVCLLDGPADAAWMQAVAAWTPFPWTLAFPVEVLLGRRSGGELLLGYAAQLVWVVVALLVLRVLWRRATRRYSAVGA